jgi:hypothetical protein
MADGKGQIGTYPENSGLPIAAAVLLFKQTK